MEKVLSTPHLAYVFFRRLRPVMHRISSRFRALLDDLETLQNLLVGVGVRGWDCVRVLESLEAARLAAIGESGGGIGARMSDKEGGDWIFTPSGNHLFQVFIARAIFQNIIM